MRARLGALRARPETAPARGPRRPAGCRARADLWLRMIMQIIITWRAHQVGGRLLASARAPRILLRPPPPPPPGTSGCERETSARALCQTSGRAANPLRRRFTVSSEALSLSLSFARTRANKRPASRPTRQTDSLYADKLGLRKRLACLWSENRQRRAPFASTSSSSGGARVKRRRFCCSLARARQREPSGEYKARGGNKILKRRACLPLGNLAGRLASRPADQAAGREGCKLATKSLLHSRPIYPILSSLPPVLWLRAGQVIEAGARFVRQAGGVPVL